jgi:hypothetical protein
MVLGSLQKRLEEQQLLARLKVIAASPPRPPNQCHALPLVRCRPAASAAAACGESLVGVPVSRDRPCALPCSSTSHVHVFVRTCGAFGACGQDVRCALC